MNKLVLTPKSHDEIASKTVKKIIFLARKKDDDKKNQE
jgi:hypothetical protein